LTSARKKYSAKNYLPIKCLSSVTLGKGFAECKKAFVECLGFANCFCLSSVFLTFSKVFDECLKKVLGKKSFSIKYLPSVTLDKGFTECKKAFVEYLGHLAKKVSPVMLTYVYRRVSTLVKRELDEVLAGCSAEAHCQS
jgi:hypothetical protein